MLTLEQVCKKMMLLKVKNFLKTKAMSKMRQHFDYLEVGFYREKSLESTAYRSVTVFIVHNIFIVFQFI